MTSRTWSFGSLIGGFVLDVLGDYSMRVRTKSDRTWPFGSWFGPNDTDPDTGIWNNQMGYDATGVWVRDSITALPVAAPTDVSTTGATQIVGSGAGQVVIGAGYGAMTLSAVNGGLASGAINAVGNGNQGLALDEQSGTDRWITTFCLASVEIRPSGSTIISDVTGNASRAGATVGGEW